MKISALLLILILATCNAFAQAPQGINYQALARDSAGKVLSLKTVSLRMSILQNSASGTADYIETHSATTNNFGIFSLIIGKGSVVSGDFTKIDWSSGNKWLKVELDPNGGTNFVLLGASQMVSVPYALYAEKSGYKPKAGAGIAISNDTIKNTSPDQIVKINGSGATTVAGSYPNFTISSTDSNTKYKAGNGIIIKKDTISIDSTEMISSFSNDPRYPDGLKNMQPVILDIAKGPYTVPSGKNLYITHYSVNDSLLIDSVPMSFGSGGGGLTNPLLVGAGQIVDKSKKVKPAVGNVIGFLVNATVLPITKRFTTGKYTVPTGKILVLTNTYAGATIYWGTQNFGLGAGSAPPLFVPGGTTISFSAGASFNGYLK